MIINGETEVEAEPAIAIDPSLAELASSAPLDQLSDHERSVFLLPLDILNGLETDCRVCSSQHKDMCLTQSYTVDSGKTYGGFTFFLVVMRILTS